MFKLNAKFDADLLLYSLDHFECKGNTVHMLTQWCPPPPLTTTVKYHCSCMSTPVHSPWLPGFINIMQIILIILTMVGIFPDRPCIFNCNPRICLLVRESEKEREIQRERERERERERMEKHRCQRETSISCLSNTPQLQPRCVP